MTSGQIIVLPGGAFTWVDEIDYARFGDLRWWLRDGYVVRREGKKDVRLHRLILNAGLGDVVDHIDGDPLNNRRMNLRICTQAGNMRNRRKFKGTLTSKFKGVHKAKASGLWIAKIGFEGKQRHIGCFSTEEEAARAYDQEARRLFGEFARPNFCQPQDAA